MLSAYVWAVSQDGVGTRANTLAFLTLVLVHPVQAIHCRSERGPVWELPRKSLTWIALLMLAAVQWCATS